MKLIQKHFLKGSREFEIADDVINVRMKSLLKEEKVTVVLTILNPEPVINDAFLEFHSRVKCGPLLSLMIDKPNAKEFDEFVSELKQKIRQEYNQFAGLKTGIESVGLNGNSYDEPPEFENSGRKRIQVKIKPERIEEAIQMLNQHLDIEAVKPLVKSLETLKAEPDNNLGFDQLAKAFDQLGSQQGAVLTYAPYVGILLSNQY